MEFEDILVQVGDYGRFQRNLMIFFLCPVAALQSFLSLNLLFLVSAPDHWCKVPELDAWNLTTEQTKSLIMPPSEPMCSMYDLNYTDILSSSSGNWSVPDGTETKPCNDGWNYDTTNYDSTAVTKWDLVCSSSHFISLALTLDAVGGTIGTPIYGTLSDKKGRKPIFFVTVFVVLFSGLTTLMMTNFSAFLFFRSVAGSVMPSMFQLPYIISMELVGPTMRTRINATSSISWTLGMCLLPLVAWLCRNWIIFGIVTSGSAVIFLAYYKFLPESPRWLLSQERYAEAAVIMMQIAKKNGKEVHENLLIKQLKEIGERAKKEKEEKITSDETSPKSFLVFPRLRKNFLIITLCYFAASASYRGLQINSANLDGNEFLNFFLLAVVELPGYFVSWWFMDAFGRRWCAVWTRAVAGFACMAAVVSEEWGFIASLLGKFGASAAFLVMYQQAAEIYPTSLRALGMGLGGTISQILSFSLPYIVYLSVYGKYIPFLIIGSICLLSSFLASFLPETRNANLPQTVLDAEKFGDDQKFFSWNRRSPSCDSQAHDDHKPKEILESSKL